MFHPGVTFPEVVRVPHRRRCQCTSLYRAQIRNHRDMGGAEFLGAMKAVMPLKDQSRPLILLVEDTEKHAICLGKCRKETVVSCSAKGRRRRHPESPFPVSRSHSDEFKS